MVELTSANFAEVVELSREVPLLVDFWADWCAPCRQIAPILDKLASEYRGRLLLVKVNADREPLVTQQFGVRGLPTLKLVWQGQLVGELVGAQTEGAIRTLIQPYLPGPEETMDSTAQQDPAYLAGEAIQGGRLEEAIGILTDALAENPADSASRARLVELLVSEGRHDEAEQLLDQAPAGSGQDFRRQRALVSFARRSHAMPPLMELGQLLDEANGEPDLDLLYAWSVRLVAANRLEQGLDGLVTVLRRDRTHGDGMARKAILEILDMLGRDDPVSAAYRRRIANFLL